MLMNCTYFKRGRSFLGEESLSEGSNNHVKATISLVDIPEKVEVDYIRSFILFY